MDLYCRIRRSIVSFRNVLFHISDRGQTLARAARDEASAYEHVATSRTVDRDKKLIVLSSSLKTFREVYRCRLFVAP